MKPKTEKRNVYLNDIQKYEIQQHSRYAVLLRQMDEGLTDHEYAELQSLIIALNKTSDRVQDDIMLLQQMDLYKEERLKKYPKVCQEYEKATNKLEKVRYEVSSRVSNCHPLDMTKRRAIQAEYRDELETLTKKADSLELQRSRLGDINIDWDLMWKHLRIKDTDIA